MNRVYLTAIIKLGFG